MKLEPLTLPRLHRVTRWRNEERQFLRTPHFITKEMQEEFYKSIICNRDSNHRYFAITDTFKILDDEPIPLFIGMGGITNIEWENGVGEISLILKPDQRKKGKGMAAVDLLLAEAFGNIGLETVCGEVYDCGNRGFWEKVVEKNNGYKTNLIARKRWDGKVYDSMWFCIRSKQ